MGYTAHYKKSSDPVIRRAEDAKALQDIRGYIGDDKFENIMVPAAKACQSVKDVQWLNGTLGFAGISGRPFHALCRAYCLEAYRAWMADDSDGAEGVPTDDTGFALETEEVT